MTNPTRVQRYSVAICLSILVVSCAGTSSPYQPAAGTSAKTMFDHACAGCHGGSAALEAGTGFKVAAGHQSVAFIQAKIAKGGMTMPAFSGLSLAHRTALADYLLEHQP